ncbi:L,D-transpeptidase family protein [Streptomyces lacrimifluminis]|nr:L,D-transpeptidase family protein [Streptomyces lacrimifluminis]
MRKVMFAVLTALAVSGCTVQTTDPDGNPRSPVHIQVSHPPDDDKPGATPTQAPTQVPTPTPTPRKATRAPSPPAPVLWSRGDSGRDVRELQARLRQVAWLYDGPTGSYDDLTENAVRGFQGKRGLPRTGRTDTVTWQRLLRMTREPGRWELYLMGGQPAAYPDPRCLTGRVLCISKTSRTLRWMIDGRTVSTVAVRFGSQYTPTREGVFRVYWKSRHHVSTLYDSPMPYAMFFSGGQAVHYSADFAARGYGGASHGCVNIRDETAIAAIFAEVSNGDKVVVHW